jgi:1,4-dihydroxy-2-naphthoate octaprenyltransferase
LKKFKLLLGERAINLNKSILINITKLTRIHFVIGGLIAFILGALIGLIYEATMDIEKLVFGYAILFCAHLSVSFSNDYFDSESDKNSHPTIFSGGSGVLVKHPELKGFSKKIAILLIVLSIALGTVFTIYYSFPWTFLGFVIIGNLLGWYYSAPPVRLVSRGLGELSTMVTAGILLPGMGYFIVVGGFDANFLIFILPILFYGLAFILNVEIPDLESDKMGDKTTFIVKYDRSFGFALIAFLFAISSIYFFTLSFIVESSINFLVVTLISLLPLFFGVFSAIIRPKDRKSATKYVTSNVASYIFFLIILDIYFIWLIT